HQRRCHNQSMRSRLGVKSTVYRTLRAGRPAILRADLMKFSSRNLHETGINLPLRFPTKVVVEYRPGGVLADYAPIIYTLDPEAYADACVREKGWDRLPGYKPSDVWVDGAF